MKAPICEMCMNSGILCTACNQKLEEKKISELDVNLARLLYKMEQKQKIKDPSFTKTFELEELILVITGDNVPNLIGKGGRVVRILSKELGKKVRVINGTSLKAALADLLAPAPIQGINVIYRPEGEVTKVIISEQDTWRLIADIKTLEQAANILAGGEMGIIFEARR